MQILPLNGEWELRRADALDTTLPALVPGCVHADLLRVGIIADPNWRDEELRVQWVGKTAWNYAKSFIVTADLLAEDHLLLRAEGLDTLAQVLLNGQWVADVDNQHVTWEWDIKPLLQAGENRLEIRFTPPDDFLTEHGRIHPLTSWNEFGGYRHRGWLRKMHSNFGWDWSPVLVTCGIWRPITLIACSGARLVDVAMMQRHADKAVTLEAQVELQADRANAFTATVTLTFAGEPVATADITFPAGETRGAATIAVPSPQLWWPHGLGEQPFYTVAVRLYDAAGVELDSWQRRSGLRTLTLERHTDQWGESFHFTCNGVPFFAKGSNWAPPLPYSSWPEGDEWKTLLRDAASAHMNMLRIWGGAYFAPEEFYDLCDELGLTIWQDFLFACGSYPAFDEYFLASVEREARDNVRRMRHHPCIALWCGNNELEPSFVSKAWNESQMSLEDYDKIFHEILPRVMHELAPQANYWPASPCHPHRDRTDPTWPMPEAGDVHVWEIWFSDAPFENFRNYHNRFISEFGFQSFPHPQTIAAYTLPDERQYNSPVMEHHQRSQPGNKQLLKFILDWFRFPDQLDNYVMLTQLVQAMAVKIGVEHWRRCMPRTMGTLYWQLNDCWPCPSWSSIDFFGRWKALHYFAQRFFAPVLISAVEDTEQGVVTVHLSNDLRREVCGEARCTTTNLDGEVLAQECWPVTLPAGSSREVGVATLRTQLAQYSAVGLLVWLDFAEEKENAGTESHNLVLFDRPKRLALRHPCLRCTVQSHTGDALLVTVYTEKPACWVWLDTADGDTRFSDNFRCLRPGESWQVIATPAHPTSMEAFSQQLLLRDLYATYHEGVVNATALQVGASAP